MIYVSYLVLRAFAGDGDGERRFAAALGILGASILPIIHFSVQKWGGQHPMVITGRGGGLQDPNMKIALSLGFLAFTLLAVLLVWARDAARAGAEPAAARRGRRHRSGPRHEGRGMSQSESTGAAADRRRRASTPDDRATSFQAVKGEPEHYSGETLLVSAYAVLWVIVLSGWRSSGASRPRWPSASTTSSASSTTPPRSDGPASVSARR